MGEHQDHTPEPELPPEQAQLVRSVRELLASPLTHTDEFITPRPTTRREKTAFILGRAAFMLGRLTGRHKRPSESQITPTRSFSETPKTMYTVQARQIDWGELPGPEGNWYISNERATDVDTDITTERLIMYRAVMEPAHWGSPDGSERQPYVMEFYNLLGPIDDPDHIARMQWRIDAARDWEHRQWRPDD